MKITWKYPATLIIFIILFALSMVLNPMQSSPLVYAQGPSQTPTLNSPSAITPSISPANTSPSTLQIGTPVPLRGGGTITTSITGGSPTGAASIASSQPNISTSIPPANTPTAKLLSGIPVPNAGGGTITTNTGPTVIQKGAGINAVGQTFQVSGTCAPNSVGLMTITNNGGDMLTPFTWRVSLNGTPIAQNTFQLTAGQTFNINTSGLFGTLTLDVLDTTNTVVATGSMFCLSPTATPTLTPPSFQVSGTCAPNSVGLMTITNNGGDMLTPLTWRVSLNGTPIAQNTFQLTAGQTFNINTSGLFGTLTLDVLDTTNTVVATGSMFCLSPTATPTLAPPFFQVNASCAPNSVGLMTITNNGGDMLTPLTWRVSLNGTPIAQNTFQLTAGQTFNINTSGLFGTLTLDVLDTTNTVVATGSMFCLSPTATATSTPITTDTSTPTPLPTNTDTSTPFPLPTNTNTSTPLPTDTFTSTPTLTPSPTSTFTPSPTATRVPVPPRVISSNPSDHSRLEKGLSKIIIFFSQDVIHDGSINAANNLVNYLLVEKGKNNKFDTTSCQTGRSGDDVAMNFSSVVYTRAMEHGHLSFSATLKSIPTLSSGNYRLFVCGTTSIENLAGVKLNNGTDTVISFSVTRDSHKDGH